MTVKVARVWTGSEWANISVPIGIPNAVVSYQAGPPASAATGQIWVDSDGTTAYLDSNDFLLKSTASATYAWKTLYQSASATGSGAGQLWMDSDDNILYVYSGTTWSPVSTSNPVNAFQVNTKVVDSNYTLNSQYNAISAGPITINSGVIVEIPSGSSWVIV